jgi:hypothetical protein
MKIWFLFALLTDLFFIEFYFFLNLSFLHEDFCTCFLWVYNLRSNVCIFDPFRDNFCIRCKIKDQHVSFVSIDPVFLSHLLKRLSSSFGVQLAGLSTVFWAYMLEFTSGNLFCFFGQMSAFMPAWCYFDCCSIIACFGIKIFRLPVLFYQ